jgi:hypothetical protein
MTLKFLALQGAPHIYDISTLKVNPDYLIFNRRYGYFSGSGVNPGTDSWNDV